MFTSDISKYEHYCYFHYYCKFLYEPNTFEFNRASIHNKQEEITPTLVSMNPIPLNY